MIGHLPIVLQEDVARSIPSHVPCFTNSRPPRCPRILIKVLRTNITAATPHPPLHHESESHPTSTSPCHNTTAYSIDDRPNSHVHLFHPGASSPVRSIKMDVAGAGPGNHNGSMQEPAKPPSKGGSSGSTTTKRLSKGDAAKPKPLPNLTGSRFQCPKCPKTFSRIENLTRHQANRKSLSPCTSAPRREDIFEPRLRC
jgi:hypothetical protein